MEIFKEDSIEDEELILVKASAQLLSDLETALPRLLWKLDDNGATRAHRFVRQKDLDLVLNLVCVQNPISDCY